MILSFAMVAVAASCGGAGTGDDSLGAGEEASHNSSGSDKVTLCHIPPGNPGNAHTITVGAPAVRAHLAHGDYLGPCAGDVPPGSDGGVPNPNPDPNPNPNPNPNPGPGSDGGSNPNPGQCSPASSACGTGLPPCCSGLTCNGSSCVPGQLT